MDLEEKAITPNNNEAIGITSPKLLVVGVDAFSYNFFTKHLKNNTAYNWMFNNIAEGEMVVRELEAHGEWNKYDRKTSQPSTGPNWSSMYTGLKPKEHGITSKGWIKDDLDYASLKHMTVFEHLDRMGYSQGVYSMPVTYPAPKLENGWSISGFPSPLGTEETMHPDIEEVETLAELPRNIMQVREQLPLPEIESLPLWGEELSSEQRQEVVSRTINIEADKIEGLLEMQANKSTEILYYGTHAVDKICHMYNLEPDNPPVASVYTAIGQLIKQLVKVLTPKNFVMVSDHGFREGTRKHGKDGALVADINSNEALEKQLQEQESFMTHDVASIISHSVGAGENWVGTELEKDYDEFEKDEIRERLYRLGYKP